MVNKVASNDAKSAAKEQARALPLWPHMASNDSSSSLHWPSLPPPLQAAKIQSKAHGLDVGADKKGTMQLPKCGCDIEFYADESAGPDAPWVVLCHDNLEIKKKKTSKELFSASYLCTVFGPALSAKGLRWIAPSLPGWGGSSGNRCKMKLVDLLKKEPLSGRCRVTPHCRRIVGDSVAAL